MLRLLIMTTATAIFGMAGVANATLMWTTPHRESLAYQDDDDQTTDTDTDDSDPQSDDSDDGSETSSAPKVDFVRDIKPILDQRCMRCHAPPDPKDGLDLSYREMIIDSYVFAGDPEGSDFYDRMITDDPGIMMPPPDDGGPMPREETLLVRLWILEGAEWPDGVDLERPRAGDVDTNIGTSDSDELSISFERDIKPILEAHCIRCHGAENPSDGVEFTTRDLVMHSYVMPGEPATSSLFTRIHSDDPSKLMPPPDDGGPLSNSDQRMIEMWIAQGANWPSDVSLGEPAAEAPIAKSFLGKVWTFQGYFHPATVHFPVALLSMASLCVILHWLFGGGFRDAAFYCLVFGAITSVAAAMMGWASSATGGYGSNPFDWSSASFRHRWCGIAVAVFSIVLALMAIRVRKVEKSRKLERAKKDMPWQIGVLVLAVLVGITGHQGGELQYGEDYYDKAFAQFTSESNDNSAGDNSTGDDSTDDDADDP